MSEDAQLPEFDLQPDPRILPMLGEINLNQWRCLAELVDNAVDGFLAAKRDQQGIAEPEVHISIPTTDIASAKVSVRDNGPGMSSQTLETAVRAGWSGNSPVDSLGMFGMGFNIATARLGTITAVWTARRGDDDWHGLQIDFEAMRRQGHFRTPHLRREKIDPHEHGTEVSIEFVKPEQRSWFARTANRSRISRELSKAYSAMLRSNGVPITFALFVNGTKVRTRSPCLWNDDRAVPNTRLGTVQAVQYIDRQLSDRPSAKSIWTTVVLRIQRTDSTGMTLPGTTWYESSAVMAHCAPIRLTS